MWVTPIGRRRPVLERPDDGRPLGSVNAGSLRGDRATHGPAVAYALLAYATRAAPLISLVNSGQGDERCPRQEVSEAIGVGAKSLSGAIPGGNAEDSVILGP
jgi:hypothetical protein